MVDSARAKRSGKIATHLTLDEYARSTSDTVASYTNEEKRLRSMSMNMSTTMSASMIIAMSMVSVSVAVVDTIVIMKKY